jgi:UDP-2-acetamido-3-amino-2,3-dideoxy-glucuronate N-acetyltransferase
MNKQSDFSDVFIHKSSFIDDNVKIGKGTKIWHFSHILSNSNIGYNCSLGQNVCVGPNVTIGNKVKLQNNVSIFEGVTLEEGVFCGPSSVFTNDKFPRSRKVRSFFSKTLVKRYATIGANATIVCGVNIGEFALIGAGSVITNDIPPYALYYGTPGRHIGWVCECGKKLDLPLRGNIEATCKFSNHKYKLSDGKVKIID